MIRKNIQKAMAGLLGLLAITASCNKEINDKLLTPPGYGEFSTAFLSGSYYITNSASSSYAIPVGITNMANTDRTIQLSYESSTGAVAGVQYTAPASVLIPAGQSLESIEIKGLFDGYPTGRKDTLRIRIAGGDVPANNYNNVYTLVMQKYCDVDLAQLGGNYDNTFEGSYGPYTSSVSEVTSTGATSATAIIDNIYDSGISAEVEFDWSDPAAFTVIIPSQNTGFTSGGLPLFIRGDPASVSRFSACDNTITLNLQLYTSARIVDTWTSSMAK